MQDGPETIRPNAEWTLKQRPTNLKAHQYPIFQHLRYPDRNSVHEPSAWNGLLEACLPSYLRLDTNSDGKAPLDASHVAQILIAAQRAVDEFGIAEKGIDLLSHLGSTQGRWEAVVWIVKRLVETFGGKDLHNVPEAQSIFVWQSKLSLSQLSANKIHFDPNNAAPAEFSTSPHGARTLNDCTGDLDNQSEWHGMLRRDCLGSIWLSLGQMTMACADEGMKPEILEIIAYLHHMEVMPMSIYNQRPSMDPTAIQQPPTLRLFSSRILTSLSDAAWRAHEKVVVQEAKANGADHAALRPEIPGQAYRVNVAGLRPEVWMELILWSCLHGGWVVDGVKILRTLCSEPPEREWRSLSWRSLVPGEGTKDNDWDKVDYAFNTHPEIAKQGSKSVKQVQRTISSEVVNAYVDALLSITRLMYGQRGVPPKTVIRHMKLMKRLLDRSGLSLSTGSWDAILVRFIDQQPQAPMVGDHFEKLIALSPAMGEELHGGSGRHLPDYVMDPSAAVLGLFHQALLSRIHAGDAQGAFRFFQALQNRADSNKRKSIVDFMKKEREPEHAFNQSQDDLFTGNFSGIDYPAFDLQIPATTLGPFLDLVTDAKAYDFGKWLLHSHDLDGPVIPEIRYGDPALRPALIRFAAETGDNVLLAKLISSKSDLARPGEPVLPELVLRSFLNSQVNLKRWDAAKRILAHMDMRYANWDYNNLAHVARIMLTGLGDPSSNSDGSDFQRAKSLFSEMISGKHRAAMAKYDTEAGLLVTLLAASNSYWAAYCLDLDCLKTFYKFKLPAKAFNLALEGVVKAYGSVTGRHVLGLFWPHSVRAAQQFEIAPFEDGSAQPRASARKSLARDGPLSRHTIRIRGRQEFVVAIYGGLRPDLMTIRIIFQKALEEFSGRDADQELPGFAASEADLAHVSIDRCRPDLSESGMVVWAIRCLRKLRMADEDIMAELEDALAAHQMYDIRKKIPSLFGQADVAEADEVDFDNQ